MGFSFSPFRDGRPCFVLLFRTDDCAAGCSPSSESKKAVIHYRMSKFVFVYDYRARNFSIAPYVRMLVGSSNFDKIPT